MSTKLGLWLVARPSYIAHSEILWTKFPTTGAGSKDTDSTVQYFLKNMKICFCD